MPERYLGRTLGRFRIDAFVGAGGFAWVYRGWDPELDIPVAVKILKPQFAGDDTFESRFRREASVAARLRHPNIVRILGVGRDRDAVFFAMDFLPNSLTERLRAAGMLTDGPLVRTAVDVANALSFAHREGVIHRDIKTDNILFDAHGNGVVADFGIARAASAYVQETGTNMVVGTPQYFSPEQARGLQLDGRADLYSLGVTLFRAATGRVPFLGEDWYEIARQHVEDEPPKPRSLNPAIAPALEAVILRCLAKRPEDRYADAEALRADLLALLPAVSDSGEATLLLASYSGSGPRPALTSGRLLRERLRGRGVVAGMGAAAVGLALVAAITRSRGEDRGAGAAPATAPTFAPAPVASSPGTTDTAGGTVRRVRRELRVRAPREARIWLDGEPVGRGEWRSDRLAAGTYLVLASVRTVPECREARDSARVRVRADSITTVTLAPRGCGALAMDVQPDGAQFKLTGAGPERPFDGVTPLARPAVVPAGVYHLRVYKPNCADFTRDGVTIRAGDTLRLARVRLICGPERAEAGGAALTAAR